MLEVYCWLLLIEFLPQTEDEALARAMAASMQDAGGSSSQEPAQRTSSENDDELAQAIAASLRQNQGQSNTSRNSCNVC